MLQAGNRAVKALKLSLHEPRGTPRGGMRWFGCWVVSLVLSGGCTTAPREPRPARLTAATGEPLAAGLAAGEYDEANRFLAEAERRYPALGDYTLYFRARAAVRAGKPTDALQLAEHLLATNAESVWSGVARLLAGRLVRQEGDLAAARGWLEAARASLPERSLSGGHATLALAEVDHELGDDAAALELARDVRRRMPRRLLARRARRLAERIGASHPELIPWDTVDEAEMRLREGDLAGARAAATTALAGRSSPALAGRALWVRAQAERALGDRETAEATCLHLARQLPADPLAPKALLAAATWRWNADRDQAALELFGQVARRFPASPQAPEALYASGRIHQEAGRYRDAFAAYRGLGDRFPRAPLAAEARWRAGWIRYLAGDFTAAADWFGRVALGTAKGTRVAAEYWQARALARLGRAEKAHERLTHIAAHHATSYYAELAEERLGERTAACEPPAVVPRPSFPTELQGTHAERARVLAGLGFSRFARLEVDALRGTSGVPRRPLLTAYEAVDAPGAALGLAREMRPGSPGALRRYLYPLGYWDTVHETALARGVDPLLVVAVIRQESLFETDAVSPANAHGLMQLLPSTARELTAEAGAAPIPRSALHVPQTNIALGVALLRRLLDRYGGSRARTLAAYNAGEDAVGKWERRYAAREPDEFVELISFRETRDYVKAVTRNYRTYRQLYASSPCATSPGSPPNAPLDMTTTTSPGRAEPTK